MKVTHRFIYSLLLIGGSLILTPSSVFAGEIVRLQWDASSEPVGGYRLYYGFRSRNYVTSIDVGGVTHYDFDPQGVCRTYYFAVTTYDPTRQFESLFSNEFQTRAGCSSPRMSVDAPTVNATVDYPFQIIGWALDLGSMTGTGVDAVHVWAFPPGNHDFALGTFLGEANLGVSRPDVAAFFGEPRFASSGFNLNVTGGLASGRYDLGIFARSAITGSFDGARIVPITVPQTTKMSLDAPIHGTSTGIPLTVTGWAFDTRATSGTGIDMVHVWAFPPGKEDDFSVGTFLGSATLGISRPDVATFFGNPSLEPSGYHLEVTTSLPDGWYSLKVYAHNTLNGAFDATRQIAVLIVTDPHLSVDTPLAGDVIDGPFQVSGWAVDLAATTGTGVEQVHVWIYPRGNPAASTPLGIAAYGLERPDVGAYLGDSRFDPSGYRLNVTSLPPVGNHVLQIFGLSSVTGTFNNLKALNITIQPAATRMSLDAPIKQATVGVPFTVFGWAFNPGAISGVGIEEVHVWAFLPGQVDNFSVGTFLGKATLGLSRPDVAAAFGDLELDLSGYRLDVNAPLAPGNYILKVYVKSTVTGNFDASVAVQITVLP